MKNALAEVERLSRKASSWVGKFEGTVDGAAKNYPAFRIEKNFNFTGMFGTGEGNGAGQFLDGVFLNIFAEDLGKDLTHEDAGAIVSFFNAGKIIAWTSGTLRISINAVTQRYSGKVSAIMDTGTEVTEVNGTVEFWME